ncbi:MAG TPA: hypothetical protein P5205_14620 [Candidatus Paceibacterota bacterium]|nr:hypothetical protein [Verrucomicrobiota bacterium]HSA11596.1 hypothetical protein [Candidatus Paceibacterota bacterium]
MIPKNKVGKAFTRLLEKMDRSAVSAMLGDWNGSDLSEDGAKIFWIDERSGTGKLYYSKSEFFAWLFSDEPLDPAQYALDQEWVDRVKLARQIATEV